MKEYIEDSLARICWLIPNLTNTQKEFLRFNLRDLYYKGSTDGMRRILGKIKEKGGEVSEQ